MINWPSSMTRCSRKLKSDMDQTVSRFQVAEHLDAAYRQRDRHADGHPFQLVSEAVAFRLRPECAGSRRGHCQCRPDGTQRQRCLPGASHWRSLRILNRTAKQRRARVSTSVKFQTVIETARWLKQFEGSVTSRAEASTLRATIPRDHRRLGECPGNQGLWWRADPTGATCRHSAGFRPGLMINATKTVLLEVSRVA